MFNHKASSSFCDWAAAARVLEVWRKRGSKAADLILSEEIQAQSSGLLLQELHYRLHREPCPRLLIDGCWLSRPHGGVTRVWQQIFSTFQLPGLIIAVAPAALFNRYSQLSPASSLSSLVGQEVDPLDPEALAELSEEISSLFRNGSRCVLFELDQ